VNQERTIGQLVADATRDISDLVRHEIALAKAELSGDVKAAGLGAGLLAGAAFFGAVAFLLLCVAAALGLAALGLPDWVAFLVVVVVLLAVAAVLGLLGKKRLSSVSKPERTLATSKETVAALKGQRLVHGKPTGTPAGTPVVMDKSV
jgi:membrane protein implicated in regulation of membrane protease activity